MNNDDATLTDAALAAFQSAIPDEAVVSVETITRGWDSLALLVNGRWLLRVARRADVGRTLAKEARLLPVIADAVTPVQVPRFRLTRLDVAPAVVGYEVIRGEPLGPHALSGGEAYVAALAGELATFLSALHRIPSERAVGAGLDLASAADWRAEYVEFREWSRAAAAPLLGPVLAGRLERLWAGYLDDDRNFAFQPALVHRDLGTEHVLLAAEDGGLVGVIDWGDAALGDPAMDFAGLVGDLGEALARRVIAGWDGPRAAGETTETLLARARFYTRLAPLHGVRFGLETGQDAYTRLGVAGLLRSLPDPNQPDPFG
jgi:aminoglycoside 2''-phosphotransferase